MIDDAYTYRSKEQVLIDLAKALKFSLESLEQNRQGKLSNEQGANLRAGLVQSAAVAFVMAVFPLLAWTQVTSSQEQVTFFHAFPIFVQQLFNLGALAETVGKMGIVMRVGSLVMGLGLAAVIMTKFSVHLLFDLIDGTLVAREGRVVAREEQTLRENGRDPIEKYYFDLKGRYYKVSLAAYRALENGSIYVAYVLPRSNTMVSIEPKVNPSEIKAAPAPPAGVSTPEPVTETGV